MALFGNTELFSLVDVPDEETSLDDLANLHLGDRTDLELAGATAGINAAPFFQIPELPTASNVSGSPKLCHEKTAAIDLTSALVLSRTGDQVKEVFSSSGNGRLLDQEEWLLEPHLLLPVMIAAAGHVPAKSRPSDLGQVLCSGWCRTSGPRSRSWPWREAATASAEADVDSHKSDGHEVHVFLFDSPSPDDVISRAQSQVVRPASIVRGKLA